MGAPASTLGPALAAATGDVFGEDEDEQAARTATPTMIAATATVPRPTRFRDTMMFT
jgi:hypothetical protein